MSQEGTSSHVLHVRENSASEMEALFKVVDPHSQEPTKSVPFRDRNLPASFFQQPGLSQMSAVQGGVEKQSFGEMGPIGHMRARSSPATLQQTLSAAPPPSGHQHQRQHSCELLDEPQPLPPGWGMARTPQGQRYFLNHQLQITTWQDPRKSHSPNSMGSSPQQPGSPASGTQTPPTQVDITKVPLPPGWERAFTADGEVYFINHLDKTTSWFHPAVPPAQQQRVAIRQQQQQLQQQQQQLQQQQQQHSPSSQQPSPQQKQQQAAMCSPGSDAGSPGMVVGGVSRGPAPGSTEQQRQMKLKQVQLEKEWLMKRQEELNRQEMMIRKGTGAAGAEAPESSVEMTTVADPFLGQAGSNTDHSRQESGDSGLGGMGTSYSLTRTPDDFLSNLEDMEIQDSGPKLSIPGDYSTMDIGSVGDVTDSQNMDSEDLVPSLQEDIGSELLKDVETVLNAKGDSLLTWL